MPLKPIDINAPGLEDLIVETDATRPGGGLPTPCIFRTGIAGSGKTFGVKKAVEAEPSYALLTATTGIAAVNLGSVTFWSALGLHPDSIEDQFTSGMMRMRMHQIARSYRWLAIDEASMLSGLVLDMFYQTAEQVNEYADLKWPFGLLLVGDLCQLPPINAPWIFESQCWPKFDEGTERLTKSWRQAEGSRFLDALNHLRRGDGRAGASLLNGIVKWDRSLNPAFDGTVILGKNKQVDNYNSLRYMKHRGTPRTYQSHRWGKQRSEWANVPETLQLKDNLYVMVLSNDTEKDEFTREPLFRWVNGDCGHIVECCAASVKVKLVRTGEEQEIGYVARDVLTKDVEEFDESEVERAKESGAKLLDGSSWDKRRKKWIRGAIAYMPLRLAYATTVHKSQGLTLTGQVAVDLREPFVGEPAMVYVALSRATLGENLHLVGSPETLARRCRIDEKVRRWL